MVATTTARKFCPDTGDVKMNEVFLELRLSLEVGRGLRLSHDTALKQYFSSLAVTGPSLLLCHAA